MKPESVYNVVSLSGGKDSTAMLLMMLERGERVDEVITADTGMEFPQMYEHLEKVEQETAIKITRLKHPLGFEHLMFDHVMKRGRREGERGYGWARPRARWCTTLLKTNLIGKHVRKLAAGREVVHSVGIAADEPKRIREKRYPLVEYGVTEAEALAYCKRRGYDWGGLYDEFSRVSCWCCPLKSLPELRMLRKKHPDLWNRLREMDERAWNSFTIRASAEDLERRFAREELQGRLGI